MLYISLYNSEIDLSSVEIKCPSPGLITGTLFYITNHTFGFFFFITLHFSRTCLEVSTGLNVSSSFPDFNFSALSVLRSSGCYISILYNN